MVGVCSSGRSSAASGVPGQEDRLMDSSIQLASVSGVMLPSVKGRSVYGVMVPSIPSWKDRDRSSSAHSRSPFPSTDSSVMVVLANVSGRTLLLSTGRMSSSCTSSS